MKKLLLATTLVGGFMLSVPAAQAEISLEIGGHFKGYTTVIDQDEATGLKARTFDIVRQTEIHMDGKTTLDNGLTVGYHTELETDGGDGFEVEQGYTYFESNWGKVHFGSVDGVAYHMQVAAPAADSNVDGLRQTADAVNYNVAIGPGTTPDRFDYDHAVSGYADKISYFTPMFSGLQFGVSYSPDLDSSGFASSFGVRSDDVAGNYGDAWDLAARYEGEFNAVKVKAGAGYTHASLERTSANADDREAYNLGLNVGFGAFKVGGAYFSNNNGLSNNGDSDTWVLGADYTTGDFVIGASYYNREDGSAALTSTEFGGQNDTNRYSVGVMYKYGPGMTLRSSLHQVEHDIQGATRDIDATYLMLGTQINF